jgi:hypothetical protein
MISNRSSNGSTRALSEVEGHRAPKLAIFEWRASPNKETDKNKIPPSPFYSEA